MLMMEKLFRKTLQNKEIVIAHSGARFYLVNPYCQTEETTAIRRIAVQETCVNWHHGGLIEGIPENPRTLQHYRIVGF